MKKPPVRRRAPHKPAARSTPKPNARAATGPIVPLRDIPVRITVEGQEVAGEITFLTPNNMMVVILTPVTGLGTSLHVPHFAMAPVNWLASLSERTTTAITRRGRSRARDLLREIYNYSRGRGSGWGMCSVGPRGWRDLPRAK
jgi:hypothetical protein